MKSFNNDDELIQFAETYVGEKLSSLKKDVNHCLVYPYASFPAILYCFSIIDFLGSIYYGQASSKHRSTSSNARKYMKKMMNYTDDQCNLLHQIFRHKIVHLAGPKTVYEYNGKRITWHYRHESPEKHLSIESTPPKTYVLPTSKIRQDITHTFWISIKQFTEDIIQSFYGPNGYFLMLKVDPKLKKNFDEAVFEMFSVDK